MVRSTIAVGIASASLLVAPTLGGPVRPQKYFFAKNTVVQICSDTVVRVAHVPQHDNFTAVDDRVSLIAEKDWEPVTPTITTADGHTNFTTQNLIVSVKNKTGEVQFFDLDGHSLLQETGSTFEPVIDMDHATYQVRQAWNVDEDESLFGGGEFQNGFLDYSNVPIELVQFNTEAVVPFFVSNKGYGILWDNYAWSHLNDAQAVEITFRPDVEAEEVQSLDQATRVVGAPCLPKDTASTRQFWAYNESDLRFHSLHENMTQELVLDYDPTNNVLHLWSKDETHDENQQWELHDKSLKSVIYPDSCLQAMKQPHENASTSYYVQRVPCEDTKLQHWAFEDKQLKLLDGSDTCLTADRRADTRIAEFTTKSAGTYGFFVDGCDGFGCGFYKNMTLEIRQSNGKKSIIDWGSLSNLPDSMAGRISLEADETYTLYFYFNGPLSSSVYMTTPEARATTLSSDLGDLIDYYFTFESASSIDGAIRGYRSVTGDAPIYPRWVYGFWQCKEHYDTQGHLLEAAHGYRNRFIPVDNIVQDWHYWGNLGWGPQWDPAFYQNPAGMVEELNSLNMQLMVSVWSKFDNTTTFYQTMEANGQMLGSSVYYDAWNPMAREQFYQYSKEAMFDIGVSCLWLDATEPENFPNINTSTYLGTGNALFNSYSLMTTKAIADGLRTDFPEEQGARVFSLTRSSFAGQQKNGAALWSGDIKGAWDSLRRQVSASLNFQLSGMPYWSEDIGGFFRPDDQYTSHDYHQMLVRWFQFGAFTPIYRVHGGGSNTEIWNYGKSVETLLNATNNLRYRFLPYIYSGFYQVEVEGFTMQRALVFDFPSDLKARQTPDQFMWGSALMVCPVVTNETSREVYAPATMIDFWTGETVSKGQFTAEAPLHQIPLYGREGSIITLGPLLQWTDEKPADPLEVRVYGGKSAKFTLFEDDGTSLDYRSGAATTIEFSYEESSKTLTIGKRKGEFPGMLETRTINVVLVRPGHGIGADPTPMDKLDEYVADICGLCPPMKARNQSCCGFAL